MSAGVAFSYRESQTGEVKQMVLAAEEFIRRFLQHVLPKGFRRVRSYGWLSPAARDSFERVSAFLGVARIPRIIPKPKVTMGCPHCRKPMRIIASVGRLPVTCRPP